jgi:hypothetical protein
MMVAAVAFLSFGASVGTASAQVVKDSACVDEVHGVTWDCHFHIKDMVVGQPVTFNVNYTCNGTCGPVTSFGLGDKGFYPPADVAGHLVGGARMPSGISLTFVFDSLRTTGNHNMGTANFMMNLMAPDGSGGMVSVPMAVDVRLKSTKD